MDIVASASVRQLGLAHIRVWTLKGTGALEAGEGLTSEELPRFLADREPVDAHVEGYRSLLKDLGHPSTAAAGERLRALVAERGWRSYGPVVDAVNVATLVHGGGIGLHAAEGRVSDESGPQTLLVTRAPEGCRIVPAFTQRSRPVPAGDLIYGVRTADGLRPMAWLGRKDCDSADFQLGPDDTTALMVVLGYPGCDAAHTADIGATVAQVLAELRPDITLTPHVVGDEPGPGATNQQASPSPSTNNK